MYINIEQPYRCSAPQATSSGCKDVEYEKGEKKDRQDGGRNWIPAEHNSLHRMIT